MGSIVSARAIFLIVAIGLHLHIPVPELILLIVGYTLVTMLINGLNDEREEKKFSK